ncbi:MAG: hypothetical protein AAFX08_04695 [Pseudomonadota bacterium]
MAAQDGDGAARADVSAGDKTGGASSINPRTDGEAARRALFALIAIHAAVIGAGLAIYLNTHDVLHLVLAAFAAGGVGLPLAVRWADRYGRGGRR